MGNKTSKTSKANFEYFTRCTKDYIKRLGMLDFEYEFAHKNLDDIPELKGSIAGVEFSITGRNCTVILNTIWEGTKISNFELKKAALHEVLHMLLCDYDDAASGRFNISTTQLATLEHAVIQRLLNFILGEV